MHVKSTSTQLVYYQELSFHELCILMGFDSFEKLISKERNALFLCWLIPGNIMACHATIHFCAFAGYKGDKILVEEFRVSHVFSFIEEYIQAISTHSCDLKQRSSLCRMQKSRRNLNPSCSHYFYHNIKIIKS